MKGSAIRVLAAALPAMGFGVLPVIPAGAEHAHIECQYSRNLCAEVEDPGVFGYYVGHDEPSLLFYSNAAGSGNQMRYSLTLPSDPVPGADGVPLPGQSFNFQLHPAFWFGMAVCDTQSAPRPLGDPANPVNPGIACTPDSDSNVTTDAGIASHPGTAFMEMQFYPPGWALWPPGVSCSPTQWCAALTIDSLLIDYYHGTDQNTNCQHQVGVEPVNFAFITKTGAPHAPPSPVNATGATFTPNLITDLFMNSGDSVQVTMHDTTHGLRIDLADSTTGQGGSMTASAANGFGQVQYDSNGSTCKNLPYDFHPEYSTSSEQTRVPWAAHSYNIAFSDEIGHFDYCSHVTSSGGCNGSEGLPGDLEPSDKDDNFCFGGAASSLVRVAGCLDTNSGFDGASYLNAWPDGSANHPTPIVFTSPRTGPSYSTDYGRMAFETDLPRIEAPDVSPYNPCNRSTGVGCVKPPLTDDHQAVDFYPFFSAATGYGAACAWALGNDIPGHTFNDFGKADQYGPLLRLTYPLSGGLGATTSRFNDFRSVQSSNPCTA